jgi:hypothetical protein
VFPNQSNQSNGTLALVDLVSLALLIITLEDGIANFLVPTDNRNFYEDCVAFLLGPGHNPLHRDDCLESLHRIMKSAALDEKQREVALTAEWDRFDASRERRWMERDPEACRDMERVLEEFVAASS